MTAPLPLFLDLPTPDEMARRDVLAFRTFCQPDTLLMENAGREAFALLRTIAPITPVSRVLVLAGKGNNGGDGIVLARLLHDAGYQVLLYCLAPVGAFRGAARLHLRMARQCGVPILTSTAASFGSIATLPRLPRDFVQPHCIVDALVGTGLRGELRPHILSMVQAINQCRDSSFIFSLDIPSGLHGLEGKPMPISVAAHATICFEEGKPGLLVPEARQSTGALHIRDIGMAKGVKSHVPASWQLLAPRPSPCFLPRPGLHKGQAGRVLVIGGSGGMTGAPLLAGYGAIRAGAGLVKVVGPEPVVTAIRQTCPEIMASLAGKEAQWHRSMLADLYQEIASFGPGVIVLGPGMGATAETGAVVQALLAMPNRCPFIIDADALRFAHGPEAEAIRHEGVILLRQTDVLTPHPTELGRMLPRDFFPIPDGDERDYTRQVQASRSTAALAFTATSPATLVLKGAGTLVCQTGRPMTLSPFAVPALATAGSGDVLAGCIAALIAKNTISAKNQTPYSSFEAACLGVFAHAHAGCSLGKKGQRGFLAREIADALPESLAALCSQTTKAPLLPEGIYL